ncbi:Uncharacterised protein [Mycobacteroides abscessus subsp. abscessus]|uniref:Uncharacterized protein n=1 Tax=Mycobacteroides abscessus subsp. bolletii TaxID=319705 RepID=A0A9Q7SGJ4_9MYCO|nr:hypothetical protein [Mycobacteroides abscessus]SHT47446.1 Uncharacterised protein [Mycobacteroides abscessus subsp. abscessus]SHT56238.1 Uncharacterised protein [Mycobacteroides abscessus subsp. abscessus]SHU55744.1 Uncharacterised protein [Mycobacteroides abscessus subsp. bolletii]SHU73852.1 Uncharacterised protein [Mycobacteroides abscessus subsp. bolletii]SHX83291.1 Uncharacterised protein [Mycobacteroides abscessus subsp. bolletii]
MSPFTITPEGVPELALPSAIASSKGISSTAVRMAIATGRLPALALKGAHGKVVYAIRPQDADKLWGSPAAA